MPKVTGTRKLRAAELLERAQRGPCFEKPLDGTEFTPELARKNYALWSGSWLVPLIEELVPELKSKQASNAN